MKTHRKSREEGGFTQISNATLSDTRLSLKARGLLALLLSLPPNWNLNVRGLVTIVGTDGETAIRGALGELQDLGYVTRSLQPRDGSGRMGAVEYEVHEVPALPSPPRSGFPHAGNPRTDKPRTGEPHADNRALYNTVLPKTALPNTVLPKKVKTELEQTSKSVELLCPIPASGQGEGGAKEPAATLGGAALADFVTAVDAAMQRNTEMAASTYWPRIDANIRKDRPFGDVFGADPRIAWTTTENGYLREIVTFCTAQWADRDPVQTTAALIRVAFRNKGKAFQFLKHWTRHCGGRVSLAPYLTLAGGRKDPAKRLDVLRELAVKADMSAIPIISPAATVTEPDPEPESLT